MKILLTYWLFGFMSYVVLYMIIDGPWIIRKKIKNYLKKKIKNESDNMDRIRPIRKFT